MTYAKKNCYELLGNDYWLGYPIPFTESHTAWKGLKCIVV